MTTFGYAQMRGLSKLSSPPGKCMQISPRNSVWRLDRHDLQLMVAPRIGEVYASCDKRVNDATHKASY